MGSIPYPKNMNPIMKKAKRIETSEKPKTTLQEGFGLFSILRNLTLLPYYEMATLIREGGHFHGVVLLIYFGSPGHEPTTPFTAYSILSRWP